MDEKRKKLEKPSQINSDAQSSSDTRAEQVPEAKSEAFHPKRAAVPVEGPNKCYLLRELSAERRSIEKGMLDVDRLILKLLTSGTLDFISLNNITRYPVRNDRTLALLDHFLQINNNGILRQFVSHMRDPVILNAEALNWAEYMQGCSDSCCMFFIKKYADVFKYVLEEYGVERFAEHFVKSGMLKESESNDLCISSICACSLAVDHCAGQQTKRLGVKVVDAQEEQKEKETSEDEFVKTVPATGDSKSKKRRKRSRGKKGKKAEAAAQTLPQEAEILKEPKSSLTQSNGIPKEQNQELTQETEATGSGLKPAQGILTTAPDLKDNQRMPAPFLVSAPSPAESCDSNNRSENEPENEETSQIKILDGMVDACVNTDDVDFKETFKKIEEERNGLISTIEDLRDSCKQIENESHLEIKAWKQRIQEKEKQCESLQQEIVTNQHQLQEESCKLFQEQKNHQIQLLKVKEQIRVKRSQFERYEKSVNDKNEEIVKLKKEFQNEQEQWRHEKLQLEEELATAQQNEIESMRKAISQESLLLEMRRDFLLRNLKDALLETEHQLRMLGDKMTGQIADPSQIQAAINKWEAVAADLRSKIEYTKANFNKHIYLIKNGAKLSNLPALSNPEPPTPLALRVLKSGRKTSSRYLPGSQHSLQMHAATTTAATTATATSSLLQECRNRSELSSFVDQGQIEQELWIGIENQKASKQFVQQQSIEEDPCVICHEELVPPKDCYELECKHVFHKKCIDYWLKEQSTCPICRILVLKPEDYPQLSKK
ncbi:E3 ubiquitin-protein ligase DZIP3-like isoform X4 [Carcharodon carcharias]|uniref:E3 ubiquitin-protein ligase DZIP3-like isoform X4 n=1 Tax=Carcharodon carcharias TaxID=13397 RepID=UPI001B7EACDB|nr:E3 ubiquitin-protein ligase DZIP3-like isoform X4 [Carcharodon carcharias]